MFRAPEIPLSLSHTHHVKAPILYDIFFSFSFSTCVSPVSELHRSEEMTSFTSSTQSSFQKARAKLIPALGNVPLVTSHKSLTPPPCIWSALRPPHCCFCCLLNVSKVQQKHPLVILVAAVNRGLNVLFSGDLWLF